MESEQKNEKGKNIIIGVLSVLVLILMFYICYDKILKNKDSSIINNNDTDISKESLPQNIEKEKNNSEISFFENMKRNRKLIQEEQNDGINMILDKSGNVYYSVSSDYSIESDSFNKGQKKEYNISDYFSGPGVTTFEGYKLNIQNVISIYHSYKGNGGNEVFVFIKEDGSIGELTYYVDNTSKKITIQDYKETVSGFSNIVSVVHSDNFGAKGYRLIDIHGNIYDMKY